MSTAEREAIEQFILRMGEGSYSYVKHFADGQVAWLARFAFTTAILYGLEPCGHRDRWCYQTMADARRALDEWNGEGEPQGWHRHPDSGRRINGSGDMYIQP